MFYQSLLMTRKSVSSNIEKIRLLLDDPHKVFPSVPTKLGDSSTCVFYGPISLKGNGPVKFDELD